MSDQASSNAHPWLEPMLLAFIEQQKLSPSLLVPLQNLLDRCMMQMSEVFDSEQLEQLAAKASWEPVILAQQQFGDFANEQLKTLEFPEGYDVSSDFTSFDKAEPAPQRASIHEPLAFAATFDAGSQLATAQTMEQPISEEQTKLTPEEEAVLQPMRTLEFPPEGPAPLEHEYISTTGLNEPTHVVSEEASTDSADNWQAQETLLSSKLPRYTRQERIAVGGMGQIWRVLDKDLNRTLAMKMLQEPFNDEPEILSRFITEAQITAQLDHPSIVPVYEFGRLVDGQYYYTMKEIKGQTFHEAIQEFHMACSPEAWQQSYNGWNLRKLLKIFLRVCETVGYAHSLDVMHRDLKPENIVLGDHNDVFLLDWGLAKILKTAQRSPHANETPTTAVTQHTKRHSTQPGDILGTPSYMAPEQMVTPHKVDIRCDVYALGAILYELLAGAAPYMGGSAEEVLYQMMMGPPAPPGRYQDPGANEALFSYWRSGEPQPQHTTNNPPVPRGLIELCAKAMQRKPQDRYDDAQQLAEAIETWLDAHTNPL